MADHFQKLVTSEPIGFYGSCRTSILCCGKKLTQLDCESLAVLGVYLDIDADLACETCAVDAEKETSRACA
jgi:hypothetical protein